MFPCHVLRRLQVQRVVESRGTTDIFVVPDPGNAPRKVRFLAGLVGGVIAAPSYLQTRGREGAAIAFETAVSMTRMVYITMDFLSTWQQASSGLMAVLLQAQCKWQLVTELELLEHVNPARAGHAKRQREALVFLTEAEQSNRDCRARHVSHPHTHSGGPSFKILLV